MTTYMIGEIIILHEPGNLLNIDRSLYKKFALLKEIIIEIELFIVYLFQKHILQKMI